MLALATATPEVLPAETGRAAFVKSELISMGRRAADLILTNGLLLREYRQESYFKEDGFTSFDEAIESMKERSLLDYGARQARHFIDIVEMVDKLTISPDEISKIGISKLREIASLKDSQAQLELLGTAADKTVGEIQQEAKRLRDKAAGRETDPLSPITLMLTETQKSFFKECMARGRHLAKLPETASDAFVLTDVVLADWFSGAAEETPADV